MSAIRSLSVFGTLYLACLVSLIPGWSLPGLTALLSLLAGFLIGFPADRVVAFWLWASESLRRVKEYRTCVVSTPRLKPEARDWHFIGHIHRRR